VKGLDVTTQFLKPVKSHMFDWQAVADSDEFTIQNKAVIKDKIQFVVLKATLGASGKPTAFFKENWAQLTSMYRNFVRGAYHFLLVGPKEDGVKQANAYLSVVGSLKGALPPVLDVEDSRDEVLAFLGIQKGKGVVNKKLFEESRKKCINDIKDWIKTVREAT